VNLWISLKQEPPRQRLRERCDTRGAEDRAWYLNLIAAELSFYVHSGVPLTIRHLAGRRGDRRPTAPVPKPTSSPHRFTFYRLTRSPNFRVTRIPPGADPSVGASRSRRDDTLVAARLSITGENSLFNS
jgi:hypothetical protein